MSLRLTVLEGMPEIEPGQNLADLIVQAIEFNKSTAEDGDLLAVCQKIVSKAEGRYVDLGEVRPSARAQELAAICHRDARLVEVVLSESSDVVRAVPGVLITRHRLGFVVANAAVDQSNLAGEGDRVLLLPHDPDGSAARLRGELKHRLNVDLAVLITDSFGRPFRLGTCGVALGCSGLTALQDLRGGYDRSGRVLQATQVAIADQLAAAATLMMGEADEGRPAVLVSGLSGAWRDPHQTASRLIRSQEEDLFR